MKKLILGCGYVGSRVAAAWLDNGDEVTAVTRSGEHAGKLSARGIQPIVGDVTGELDLGSVGALFLSQYGGVSQRSRRVSASWRFTIGLFQQSERDVRWNGSTQCRRIGRVFSPLALSLSSHKGDRRARDSRRQFRLATNVCLAPPPGLGPARPTLDPTPARPSSCRQASYCR